MGWFSYQAVELAIEADVSGVYRCGAGLTVNAVVTSGIIPGVARGIPPRLPLSSGRRWDSFL